MYFNIYSDTLPFNLNGLIEDTYLRISKSDQDQKYDIEKLYRSLPFNLVDKRKLREQLDVVKDIFMKASVNKSVRRSYYYRQYIEPGYLNAKYLDLLEDTFRVLPPSLFVKKGVSTLGKEVLVSDEFSELPLFFFKTVYPLCWFALNEKNTFSISKHPIYPLFHRYISEPLAVAMSLDLITEAFGKDSYATNTVIDFIQSLPKNYYAGTHLYNSKLHLRWKDWRDESHRCYNKFDTIEKWIDLLSGYNQKFDNEQIISLWATLFDLSDDELQGLKAAAKYAPLISEGQDLYILIQGLLEFAIKNEDKFNKAKLRVSDNGLSRLIAGLLDNCIHIDDAINRIPDIVNESTVCDLIANDLPGWSFAQDMHTGCFRIYGPTVKAILKR